MKQEMSGVDVHCVVDELSALVDGRVGKVYQHGESELRLTVHKAGMGRQNITLEAGRRIHLTRHPKLTRVAPSFAMLARKHLQGARLASVSQQGFDRLVWLKFERGGETKTLVAELFARGNVLILDEQNNIVASLKQFSYKDRSLRMGRQYLSPPSQPDPEQLDAARLSQLFGTSDSDLVRTLATRAGLGGLYAEEVCALASLEKHTPCAALSAEEAPELLALEEALKGLLSKLETERKPAIVLEGGKRIDCVPVELVRYAEHEKLHFDTFSEALDEFFFEDKPEAPPVESHSQEGALEHRLTMQRRTLERYEKQKAEAQSKAELLYANYTQVEKALHTLRQFAQSHPLAGIDCGEVNSRLQDEQQTDVVLAGVNPIKKTATLVLDGVKVEALVEDTLERSAQRYYEVAKKLSRKVEGAKRAIESTGQMLEKPAQNQPREPRKGFSVQDILKKPAWYEQFRWFFSSDGFLVIGGRDAHSNERVYEKYMEKRDLVVHAQAHGAPLTVVKTQGESVPESTLQEAAVFAVSFSNVWKAGQFSGECYLISPEQVSKTPESGEYIPTGSFVIRGKRKYYTVPVGAAIGIEKRPLRLIAGPTTAVEHRAALWFELEPGQLSRDDAAKRIYRKLAEQFQKGLAKRIAPPDKIATYLPPGGTSIKAEHIHQ